MNAATLKRRLWDMTGAYHFGNKSKLQQWLIDEQLIKDDQLVATLTADQLSILITDVGDWIAKKDFV